MMCDGKLLKKCNLFIRELQNAEKCIVELVENPETQIRYVKKRILGRGQRLAFQKELAVARILDPHPNIIQLLDCKVLKDEKNQPFEFQILYEYCEGGDLYDFFAKHRRKRIRKADVWNIMNGVIYGIKTLHENHIIHRDIKLENVVLTADMMPKLCDFSFSEWDSYRTQTSCSHVVQDNPSLLKIDRYLIGTCGYLSPDLITTKIATPQSDIFSLGVLFYELFTSENAFESGCAVDFSVDPEQLYFPRRCTKNITDMIKAMLSKHPQQRPKVSQLLEFFSKQ